MTDAPTWLTDNTHVLVSGVTGSGDAFGGKTSTAAWWLDMAVERGHFDYALAFDLKGGRFPGADVTNAHEAAEAVQRGERRLDWTVNGSPVDMGDFSDEHAEAMSFASGLNGSVIVAHDDAVMYGDADSLRWATALAGNPSGGDHAVKSLVISQDPWDLPRKGVRSNLPVLVWVGPTGEDSERYFDVMKKSAAHDLVSQRHTEPFMWSAVDGDGSVTTYGPVPEKYA